MTLAIVRHRRPRVTSFGHNPTFRDTPYISPVHEWDRFTKAGQRPILTPQYQDFGIRNLASLIANIFQNSGGSQLRRRAIASPKMAMREDMMIKPHSPRVGMLAGVGAAAIVFISANTAEVAKPDTVASTL